MAVSQEFLRLLIAAPVTRFLVSKDVESLGHRKPLVKRHFLSLAILLALSLFAYPFTNKVDNYFDRFNTIVAADPSTVYQQYRRSQTWIDSQVESEKLDPEEAALRKAENDEIYKRIKSPVGRLMYIRFGDILDYSKPIEEPSFIYAAGYALNHVVFFISLSVGLCYYLPAGGLVTIFLFLLSIFCLELEARFVAPESLFDYLFFLNANEWTVFEAIEAAKESLVGIVCGIIIVNGVFANDLSEKTRYLIRKVLRTNASIVTVLKDDNIDEVPRDTDTDDSLDRPVANIGATVTKVLGLIALVSSVFFRDE